MNMMIVSLGRAGKITEDFGVPLQLAWASFTTVTSRRSLVISLRSKPVELTDELKSAFASDGGVQVSQFVEIFNACHAERRASPGEAGTSASRSIPKIWPFAMPLPGVLFHAFFLESCRGANNAVLVELPIADGQVDILGMDSTRPRAPASRDRSCFVHHDRKKAVIFKLKHSRTSGVFYFCMTRMQKKGKGGCYNRRPNKIVAFAPNRLSMSPHYDFLACWET